MQIGSPCRRPPLGRHAFAATPSQARFLAKTHPETVGLEVRGVGERWDMAFAILRANAAFDASYPADPHATLSFLLAGTEVERMDGRFRGRRGAPDRDGFILYPGGQPRRYLARGPVRICQLYVPISLLEEATAEAPRGGGAGLELRDDRIFATDRELRVMTDQYLRRALDPRSPPTRLEMDARALLIALRLVQAHSDRALAPPSLPGALDGERLRGVVDFIEAHLGETITLETLAREAGLSRHHFATAFRRAMGVAPHRFLVARRIARAKRLIGEGRPLAEAALDSGFASQQHFCSAFRRAVGASPAAWRSTAALSRRSPD